MTKGSKTHSNLRKMFFKNYMTTLTMFQDYKCLIRANFRKKISIQRCLIRDWLSE